ncbi:MarR family transcriptional regulator [Shewanella inventionis]|uniref:MarR family transcriptional regulator n=1 Tax=Shewanella inventionis TaxID=1738770 RepID=A0ABQ1IZ89_9GAMM|nr:MarR family transcriptional regulator [Shewanella inventionis]MCL1156947.1 MarR family transcriptional regulator [Shewanella inventionis]UAL43113.1 MarR family transcriptional regulator [Shewanella inventionis]GGB54031.1 MarR family transcriptional regulator [Shewanella inventionis]
MSTKNAANPLALENQVCFSLYSATNAMIRAYRPLLDELSLTYPQYLVMMVLWQEPGISVKTLGEKLHLDSGTLTPLLKRLETKELVSRGRSELDERVRVLHVTDAGRQLHQQALSIPEQMRCKVGGTLEELAQLKQLCDHAFAMLNSGEATSCEM